MADPSPFPKKPRLMTHQERILKYGAPAMISKTTGLLVPSAVWESRCLVFIHVPWPDDLGHKRLKVHRDAADKFAALFQAWADAGLLDRLLSFDGGHVCRMKRGREKSLDLKDLSTHAFGAAIDLNTAFCLLGRPSPLKGEKGSLVELVPLMYKHGFSWGGDWPGSSVDSMHAEIGVV